MGKDREPEEFELNLPATDQTEYLDNLKPNYVETQERLKREGKLRIRPVSVERALRPRRGLRKTPIAILLIVTLAIAVTIGGAVWIGHFQGVTQERQPLVLKIPVFNLPDMNMNVTGSTITDMNNPIFTVNTYGQQYQFTLKVAFQIHFANGTVSPDPNLVFSKCKLTWNDASANKNMTQIDMLTTSIFPIFTANTVQDTPYRLIVEYTTKNVNLGTSATIMTLDFFYTYNLVS